MPSSITLTVSQLPESTSFFLAALQPLGYIYRGQACSSTVGFGPTDLSIPPDFWLTQSTPFVPAGAAHVAFPAASQLAVQDFFRAAIQAGGMVHGEPCLRDHLGYYSAAIIDFDGNSIEAVHRPPMINRFDKENVSDDACSQVSKHSTHSVNRALSTASRSSSIASRSRVSASNPPQTPPSRNNSRPREPPTKGDALDSILAQARSAAETAKQLVDSVRPNLPSSRSAPAIVSSGSAREMTNKDAFAKSSVDASSNAVVGTLLGVAAGAALTYAFATNSARKSSPVSSTTNDSSDGGHRDRHHRHHHNRRRDHGNDQDRDRDREPRPYISRSATMPLPYPTPPSSNGSTNHHRSRDRVSLPILPPSLSSTSDMSRSHHISLVDNERRGSVASTSTARPGKERQRQKLEKHKAIETPPSSYRGPSGGCGGTGGGSGGSDISGRPFSEIGHHRRGRSTSRTRQTQSLSDNTQGHRRSRSHSRSTNTADTNTTRDVSRNNKHRRHDSGYISSSYTNTNTNTGSTSTSTGKSKSKSTKSYRYTTAPTTLSDSGYQTVLHVQTQMHAGTPSSSHSRTGRDGSRGGDGHAYSRPGSVLSGQRHASPRAMGEKEREREPQMKSNMRIQNHGMRMHQSKEHDEEVGPEDSVSQVR